jgi:predicted RNase H-like HicB family nuclease
VLTYIVAYRLEKGSFFAEVLDFPEASAFGPTVAETRGNLLSSLRYAAEDRLKKGDLLPMPDPGRGAVDAYLVERVTVLPGEGQWVRVQVAE